MKKILICDDERNFVETLQTWLEVEGFETDTAYEGVRAIEMAHKHHPDLILLDLRMPAGEGYTVLRALRARDDTKHIPVIIMTAVQTERLEADVRAAGADDFVQKPFEPEALLAKIWDLV